MKWLGQVPGETLTCLLKNYDKVHNSNPSTTNAEAGGSKFEIRLGRLHAVRFWGILDYKSYLKIIYRNKAGWVWWLTP